MLLGKNGSILHNASIRLNIVTLNNCDDVRLLSITIDKNLNLYLNCP